MRRMYSENQLKEVVNKGIQEGAIQVGTKLYKHELEIDHNGYYVMITTDKNSYVGGDLYDIITGSNVINFYAYIDDFNMILGISSDGQDLYYINSSGVLSTLSLSDTEVTNDDVTPL